MKHALIAIFLGACLNVVGQSSDTTRQVDRLFTRWNNATPGGTILISRGDKILYNKAFGIADLEHNVPNTTETIFESGSVAKQFTAMSILLLVAEGKISLTDDIRKYVPEIPVYDKPVIIQHLLNHTSGLKDWGSVGSLTGWPRTTRVYSQELALLIMSRQKSTLFTPGNEYSYSNSNYSLMLTIVERVSKESFTSFTRKRLFEPLGMTHTKWRDNFRTIVPNRSIGYNKPENDFQQLMPFENIFGHGGLLTTTSDLLKWNALLETRSIGGEQVYQWRIKKGKLNNGQEISYASGLTVNKVNGFTEISHSGATAGYRAWLAYYPKRKLSVVILSNDGGFNPVTAGTDIANIYLGKNTTKLPEPKRVSLTEADLKKFDGIFRSTRHFDVQKLELKDGKIMSNGYELSASHRDTLFQEQLKWVFLKPGKIMVINSSDTLSYAKVNPPDLSANALNTLKGEYKSEAADAIYLVEVKNGNEVWINNQPFPPYKLDPSFQNGFYFEDQFYEFKKDKKGKMVLEVSVSRAERVPFIKTEKK